MSFSGLLEFLQVQRKIAQDTVQSSKELLEDFNFYRSVLLSHHSTLQERYDSLIAIITRFSRRQPSERLAEQLDKIASDVNHLDKRIRVQSKVEDRFGFLREKVSDPDIVRIVLGSGISIIESQRERRDRLLVEWTQIVRKILDDADLAIGQHVSLSQVAGGLEALDSISFGGESKVDTLKAED